MMTAPQPDDCQAIAATVPDPRVRDLVLRLAESERRLRETLQNVRLFVVMINQAGLIEFGNPFLLETTGWTLAEVLGKNWFEVFVPKSEGADQARAYSEAVRAGEFPVHLAYEIISRDGRRHQVLWNNTVMRDIDGAIAGIVSLGEDVTIRQMAEIQAARERDRAQQYLDVAGVMLLGLDPHGKLTMLNRKGSEILGYREEEVIGQDWFEIFLPASARAESLAHFTRLIHGETTGPIYAQSVVINRQGGHRLIAFHHSAVRDAGGVIVGTLSSGEDITERQRLEQQFLRAQRMDSLGKLASGVAHDLNNILAPLVMGVTLLREEKLGPSALETLEVMETSARRGADLIRQILTFARGVDNQISLVQTKHLLREMTKVAEETFPRSIRVKTRISRALWPVSGDATHLYQVIMNLSVNARDAMAKGGTLGIAADNVQLDKIDPITAPDCQPGPYIRWTITDTGTGIAPEIQDRIFEPFFTTKEAGQGTGLGLSTALGIVRSLKGFIEVESEPGQGSTFRVYLPAHPNQTVEEPSNGNPTAPGQGQNILVVDDETGVREVIRKTLTNSGYQVLLAESGTEALGIYVGSPHKVELLITDLMMGGMDGTATIKALRQLDPALRVIVITGLSGMKREQELRELGISALLQKPFTVETLRDSVAKALAPGTEPS